MDRIRIALVGCGAVAQNGYLPALSLVPEVCCVGLVDVQKESAEALAGQWGIPKATNDYSAILEEVDAVLLAVPNHLHAPMTLEALGRKRAVMCEKPLGRTKKEVQSMVDAALRAGVPLVAGMTFRQYPPLQQIRRRFPWELLGRVNKVVASFGYPLEWPLESAYLFDRAKVGGGVLLAEAVHMVDALFWVLSLTDASVAEYWDDGESGVEAEARAHLWLQLPAQQERVPCELQASRVRRLDNNLQVIGEKATLVIPLSSTDVSELHDERGVSYVLERPSAPQNGALPFAMQLKKFAERIQGLQSDCADGNSQIRVLELIESCYASRKSLNFPWEVHQRWPKENSGSMGEPERL